MGASILLENLVIATIGPTFRTYPEVLARLPIAMGPLAIGRLDLIIFIVSAICLTGLIIFIDRTKIGKAIQAASYNIKACALMGVNTDRVILTVFGLGGFLAGVAGVFFGMKYTVYPQIGNITTKSFIAAVFGGLGSLPGAVLGSVILGTIETFVAGYLSSQFRDLIAFVILIAVLIFRPTGIMGKVTEDKA
ncbi:MAG: branched-chain amino acid ABC transporter permease [Spirochaetaceae bacterium]|nr:branched-chain amino acid ABC transporter permease [Spirochaetaceae bacterium]